MVGHARIPARGRGGDRMSDRNSVACPNLTQRHSDPEQRAGSESRYFASAATTGGTNTEILDCKQSRMTSAGVDAEGGEGQDAPPFATLPQDFGAMAVYGPPNAARMTDWGLNALHHRGKESAVTAAADGTDVTDIKGMGLVS